MLEGYTLNRKIQAFLLVLTAFACFAGCERKSIENQEASMSNSEAVSAAPYSSAESEAETTEAETADTEFTGAHSSGDPMGWNGVGEITDNSAYVSTPYGDLYYPVEYADLLNVDIAEDEYYSVAFSGRSSVGDVFLFILYFGRDDCGEMVGTYAEENGDTLSVTCQMCELNLDDRWSDEEKQQLEEEQSAVSAYVIENLTKIQGFTATE